MKIDKNGIVTLTIEEQQDRLHEEQYQCLTNMIGYDFTNTDDCPPAWDDLMCWPATQPNHLVVQKCPNYINGFKTSELATRLCTENGTWYVNPTYNRTWTNYTECMAHGSPTEIPQYIHKLLMEHVPRIITMSVVLYSISMIMLTMAVFIMCFFKKLHCPRNVVHINLFVSLILRSVVSILRETLLVDGLGLEKDVERVDGKLQFKEGGTHWECKLLMTVFHYALSANYTWIFMEGLYLHMLIFVSLFSEKSRVHWYMIIGWTSPLLFIIPWVLVRIFEDDKWCWNSWHITSYMWIIKGPIAATIIINFAFFLNIIRVLFTKLRASNSNEARKYRYRKLAKSTLVLIPLYGVPYIIFLGLPNSLNINLEIAQLYYEMAFSSIQGVLVSSLFCFLNGEVQSEIKKWYRRLRLRHGHLPGGSQNRRNTLTTWNTSMTYVQQNGGVTRPSIQSTGSDEYSRHGSFGKKTTPEPERTPILRNGQAKLNADPVISLSNGIELHETNLSDLNGYNKICALDTKKEKNTECELKIENAPPVSENKEALFDELKDTQDVNDNVFADENALNSTRTKHRENYENNKLKHNNFQSDSIPSNNIEDNESSETQECSPLVSLENKNGNI